MVNLIWRELKRASFSFVIEWKQEAIITITYPDFNFVRMNF